MTDQTIKYGDPAPGIAGFESESWGGPKEILFGDTPAIASQTIMVSPAGDVDLDIFSVVTEAGAMAVFTPGVSADEDITFSGVGVATETVTIAGVVYTMTAAVTDPGDVLIGATATESAENLVAAINATPGDAGTKYGVGTLENDFVSAVNAAGVVTVTAKVVGTVGNTISLATDSAAHITVGAATLSGGTAASSNAYGVLATEAHLAAGVSAVLPVYRAGHFDGGALKWDSSFNSEARQRVAFEGTKSPSILVSHKKFSDDDLTV